jgi:hypothetical protein
VTCPFAFHSHCQGRYQLHHVIPRQTVKGQYSYWHGLTEQMRTERALPATLPLLEQALLDGRNLLPICVRHHEMVTNHRIYVTLAMLPTGCREWAEEVGVGWYIDRFIGHESNAA